MQPIKKLKIAIFISSRGSNMEKIIQNINNGKLKKIDIVSVLSDNPNAMGLEIAKKYGISTYLINFDASKFKYSVGKKAEQEISQYLKTKEVDLICLAGFMRLIKYSLLKDFNNKIINIHPSLLPKYPGLDTHTKVIENKEKESGATVHYVDGGMDTGKIIKQASVQVHKTDTKESLSKKVLQVEHILYSEVLKELSEKSSTLSS